MAIYLYQQIDDFLNKEGNQHELGYCEKFSIILERPAYLIEDEDITLPICNLNVNGKDVRIGKTGIYEAEDIYDNVVLNISSPNSNYKYTINYRTKVSG